LRSRLHKIICLFTVFVILLGMNISPSAAAISDLDGIMSSAYGYALNDYIFRYGVAATATPGEAFAAGDEAYMSPNGGVVYADLVDFDSEQNPFLLIYLIDKQKSSAEVHILSYDAHKKNVDEIGVISKEYGSIPANCAGEFNIGYDNGKSYISYKYYNNQILVHSEYYTVIDSDAFMYVKSPTGISDTGIMDFNCNYFHSNMDISYYNKTLGNFFKKLKDTAADSVTHTDISQILDKNEEARLEDALAQAVYYCDFDISRFKSMAEYKLAMSKVTNSDKFYLITNMYSLGEEIYYVRFSTDRSFYNYTLLRRSDAAPNGYQILKVRTDCIPLSDYELESIYDTYKRSTLLLKKASEPLKLSENEDEKKSEFKLNLPKMDIEKVVPKHMKTPLALIGGGIALAVLIAVWIILMKMNKD